MKKIISLILCLLMLFSSVCTTAFADDTYEFFETRQAINRYNAEAPAEFVVPSEIDGKVVEAIMESAFRENAAAVEKLTLPESLMFIGNRNFNKSAALAEVVLPETLQVVGSEVFRESAALTEITIPASVTMIGKSSFAKNENLKTVTFTGMAPLFVGEFAFGSNHPEMVIYVPDDQIDAYIAVLPEGLNIQPSGANAVVVDYTASEDAFTFDAATGTITATTNRAPRLDIPATIGGVPVTAIGAGVFKESVYACCIIVPEGVTTIGDEAFASCTFLDYVDLPDSVTTIGAKAFNGYQGLVFEFPAQLQTIGEKAFAYSNIDVVALPEGLTEIPVSAFERAKFSSLTLPGNLTAIGEKAFYQCKYYNEVTIPASVTSIGSMAFAESDRLEKVITACDPSILPADALTDTDAVVEQFGAVEATPEPTAEPTPEPTAEPVAEFDITPFMGEWTDGFGENLLFTEDKVCMVNGEIEWNWAVKDGEFVMTWGNYSDEKVTVDADGVMHMGDKATYYRPDALSANGIPAGVEGTAEDFIGVWNASTMDVEGMTMNVADLGMVMDLTINEDGTIAMFDGETTNEGTWTLTNSVLDIMGEMQLILTEDGRLCMAEEGAIMYFVRGEAPVEAPIDRSSPEAYIGEWINTPFEDHTLTINADGTMAYTYETGYVSEMTWDMSSGEFTVMSGVLAGNVAVIDEEGILIFDDDFMKCYERTSAPVAAPVETPVETPVESPVDNPAVAVDASAVCGKWIATSAEIDGMTMDKAMLAEFGMTVELVVNEDGTASLSMEGEVEDGLSWTADDAGITLTMDGESLPVTFNDKGGLTMDFGGVYMFLEKEGAEGSVDAPIDEPIDVPVEPAAEIDTAPYMGVWYDADGNVLTFSENGEVIFEDVYGVSTMGWEVVDGKMMITTGMWWDSVLTITDGVLNANDGYYIDYNFTREQPVVEAPEATEEPEAPAVPTGVAGTAEDFVGVWNASTMDIEGMTMNVADMGMVMDLTINADGTVSMFDGETTETATWTLVDGKVDIMGEMQLALTEDGRLCMADDSAAMYFVRGEASVGGEAPAADGIVPVAGEMENFVGRWIGASMETDGMVMALSDIGMTIEITFDAYGTVTLYDGEAIEEGAWTLVDGKADIDGMICTLMSDGTMVAEDPDGAKVIFTGFVGTWKACYMSTGDLTGDLRSMGITSTLILNADGTGSIDFPTPEEGNWYTEDGYVRFGENGMPMQILTGGYLKFGSDLAGYLVFSKDENATWDPSMEVVQPVATPEPVATAEPAQAPASGDAGDMTARMNKKYVAKTYTSFGQTMDASMLGAEYSMLFYENGTCDFGIAGMVVPNLPWGLQKVATGLTEVDAFVINYYGTMFNAVLTADGFDMDYYGTMTLHFVPAE